MKTSLRYVLFILSILTGFASAFADEFKSLTFATGSPQTIRVHGDQFMFIRNFTQEGGSDRGYVMVTQLRSGDIVKVLTAVILDTSTNPPEVINNVIVAGPADVQFVCGTTTGNCFVSFKKESN